MFKFLNPVSGALEPEMICNGIYKGSQILASSIKQVSYKCIYFVSLNQSFSGIQLSTSLIAGK